METVLISPDMLFEIMIHLDANTLISLCSTDRTIHHICNDDRFWLKKLDLDKDTFKYWKHLPITNIETLMLIKPKHMSIKNFYLNLFSDRLHLIKVVYNSVTKYIWLFHTAKLGEIEARIRKIYQIDPDYFTKNLKLDYNHDEIWCSNSMELVFNKDYNLPLDQLKITCYNKQKSRTLWNKLDTIMVVPYRPIFQVNMARQALGLYHTGLRRY